MSLRRIILRDFVIVRALDLDLTGGFTVLTGETGAGKSILVEALQLALGARAESVIVRQGAARADISAEFDLPPGLADWLEQAGFEAGESLLLRRSVDAQGKSRAWINGNPATATQLRELGEQLVEIHGQHAWQSLTRPQAVRALLDAYAGVTTEPLQQGWRRWRDSEKVLAGARAAQDSLQRERERLDWQIADMDKLAPGIDEWEELNAGHTRLANAQALLDAANSALEALEGEEVGASSQVSRALALLHDRARLEPCFTEFAEVLSSSLAQIEDAAHSLHAYLRKTNLDPQRLSELDDRMSLWMSLARRYKRTPAEVPAVLAGWREELARLDAAVDLGALEASAAREGEAFMALARELSAVRSKAAPRLAKAVSQAMQGLGMQGGRFEVVLERLPEPSASGMEDVSFLVAGHSGSTPRPVGKVASGGELSRIALAIAVTTSELGPAQTLIFDEVDAGVGGAVAETVGRLLKQLGRDRQVLAVTHLPQVAACADHHLLVARHSDAAGIASNVVAVDGEQRVAEVARMLGGERLSGTTLAHAKEMLGDSAVAPGGGSP